MDTGSWAVIVWVSGSWVTADIEFSCNSAVLSNANMFTIALNVRSSVVHK